MLVEKVRQEQNQEGKEISMVHHGSLPIFVLNIASELATRVSIFFQAVSIKDCARKKWILKYDKI